MESAKGEEQNEQNSVDDEGGSGAAAEDDDAAPDAGRSAAGLLANERTFAHRHADDADADASSDEADVDRARDPDESDGLDSGSDMSARSDSDSSVDSRSSFARRSRAPSPTDSLVEHAASLRLEPSEDAEPASGPLEKAISNNTTAEPVAELPPIRERVAADIGRRHAKQTSKYHSKRGVRKIGRPKGSKAKQDLRVKVDRNGVWD